MEPNKLISIFNLLFEYRKKTPKKFETSREVNVFTDHRIFNNKVNITLCYLEEINYFLLLISEKIVNLDYFAKRSQNHFFAVRIAVFSRLCSFLL
jgi:hypothetical protein